MPPVVAIPVYLGVTALGAGLYTWGRKNKSPLGIIAQIFGGGIAALAGAVTLLIVAVVFL